MKYTQQAYGTLKNGQSVEQVTLENDAGSSIQVLTLGATWQAFNVPSAQGTANLLAGYDNLADYEATPFYVCKTVGRVAGRIGGAKFDIDGQHFTSDQNENKNTLHGGMHGFSDVVWTIADHQETADKIAVTMSLAVAGDVDHFPGDMTLAVTYTLTNRNKVTWSITGNTDTATLFNPTLHTYFNLTDHEELASQSLFINGRNRVVLGSDKVPTGELSDATGTAYDFTKLGKVTDHLAQLKAETNGVEFDDAYRVNGDADHPIATVADPESGRALDLYSSRNGLVIFTADPAGYALSADEQANRSYTALALEAQWLPDAIHHDGFGDIVLPANAPQTYSIDYQYRQL